MKVPVWAWATSKGWFVKIAFKASFNVVSFCGTAKISITMLLSGFLRLQPFARGARVSRMWV